MLVLFARLWNSSFHPHWLVHNHTLPYSWKKRLSVNCFSIVIRVSSQQVSVEEDLDDSLKFGGEFFRKFSFLIQCTLSSKHSCWKQLAFPMAFIHDVSTNLRLQSLSTAIYRWKVPHTKCANTLEHALVLIPQNYFIPRQNLEVFQRSGHFKQLYLVDFALTLLCWDWSLNIRNFHLTNKQTSTHLIW